MRRVIYIKTMTNGLDNGIDYEFLVLKAEGSSEQTENAFWQIKPTLNFSVAELSRKDLLVGIIQSSIPEVSEVDTSCDKEGLTIYLTFDYNANIMSVNKLISRFQAMLTHTYFEENATQN